MSIIRIASITISFGPHLETAKVEQTLGLEEGFIKRKAGIENLHEFSSSDDFVDACVAVANEAISKAGLEVEKIAGIYAPATLTDHFCPTLSTRVAKKLGLAQDTSSITVGLGCVGGIASVQAAYNQLAVDSIAGRTAYYAVLAADYLTNMTNKKDYKTRVLFSDGIACMVVTNDEHASGGFDIKRVYTHSLSSGPIEVLNVSKENELKWEMDGRAVADFVLETFPRVLRDLNVTPDELDLIIPHQANKRLLEAACAQEGIATEKVHMKSVTEHGNTSASSVFVGLAESWEDLNTNRIALIAFGADLQYGGLLVERSGN